MRCRYLSLVLLCLPAMAVGSRDPAALCDAAALDAATESGVPRDILLAITRVETGRDTGDGLKPWPWTINQGGAGAWFDTAEEAEQQATRAIDSGTSNLDIGCFQLNHRWHGARFPSLEAMFDPATNARYAAGFLADLYREKGDWPAAVAAYHSRSPEPAERYLARIETVLASLSETPPPDAAVLRVNTYPLLQAGASGGRGSLVPLAPSRGPLIGATP